MTRVSLKHLLRSPAGILRTACAALVLLAATSCGQTGPLALPGQASPPSSSAEPPADVADDEEDQSEQDER